MLNNYHFIPESPSLLKNRYKFAFIIFLVSFFVLFSISCRKNQDKQAADLDSCPSLGCTGSNICLKPANICVHPCKEDRDCPKSMLCRGYFKNLFRFTGKGGKFCKKAISFEGELCDKLSSGCKKEFECVDNRCRKKCLDDRECKPDERCRLEVLPMDSFSPSDTYKVCAKATLSRGEACMGGSEPFCKRGLVCIESTCKVKCFDDDECPGNEKCRYNGYFGWRGKMRMLNGDDPDFKYCK